MKTTFLLASVLFSFQASAQPQSSYNDHSDLSISIGLGHKLFTNNSIIQGETGRTAIEYRHPIHENLMLTAGLSSHLPDYPTSEMDGYVMESDTDRVSRSFDLWGTQYSINIGADYYFKENFYAIGRVQFGLSKPLLVLKDQGESKPTGASNDQWHTSDAAYEYHNYNGAPIIADQSSPVLHSPYREIIGYSHYHGYGAELGIGYQHQVTRVIQLAVQYTGFFRHYVFQKSEINYKGPGDVHIDLKSFNTFSQYLELTARIKFRTKVDSAATWYLIRRSPNEGGPATYYLISHPP